MSDGVGESHRFPPIDGLHDRCCNISNERCRRAPLEFIKSPSPRCLSAKPASAFSSELSLHTYVLELLIYKDIIPRELFDIQIKVYTEVYLLVPTSYTHLNLLTALPPLVPPLFSRLLCFVSAKGNWDQNYPAYQLGSTGINWDQLGSNWDQTGIECLIRAWSFPCSFLFSRTFRSLCALCLAIAIVLRLVRGDLHSPPSPPLDCRLIPALRPRKLPRLIGTSHNLPGLHSSNPHCFKESAVSDRLRLTTVAESQ
ncbi:hypothetical protein N7465_002786 [Penicillium sp. CMV-2018d]|nr:hypothetical protein N7465_002786 [Penicillium sp. CMV-2018d]